MYIASKILVNSNITQCCASEGMAKKTWQSYTMEEMKSYGLSCEDPQDKGDWKLTIKKATG